MPYETPTPPVHDVYSGQVEAWVASGRVEVAVFNRYSRGAVRGAEMMSRTERPSSDRGLGAGYECQAYGFDRISTMASRRPKLLASSEGPPSP
jgi:hypothetical protein